MSARLTTPRHGLDFAWSMPSTASMKAGGYVFAVGYLSHDPSKNLTPEKVKELRAAGIEVVCVWESTGARALSGAEAGVEDATAAKELARLLGKPAGRPIYFAVDFDPAGAPANVEPYFKGIKSVIGDETGVYGGYETVAYLSGVGVKWLWQTLAWSGGRWYPGAQLQQNSVNNVVGGAGVDLDLAITADYGQWGYEPPAPPKPEPHYERFVSGKFPYHADGYRSLNEREIVEAWDAGKFAQGQVVQGPVLQRALTFLRKRVWYEAVKEHPNADGTPSWETDWRGWRWQQLKARTG